MNFPEFCKTAWFGPLETEGVRFNKKDLDIKGTPIFKSPREDRDYVTSIVRERQQAANWLIGTDPVYSEVSCDT